MLPELTLECPYWPESADLVAEVEARFGVRVVVLRLLEVDAKLKSGGRVTYLAELSEGELRADLLPVAGRLRERARESDSKRMPWAEVGGPARSLVWARTALEPSGQSTFVAVQQRSWNLSTLWRLETVSVMPSTIWLKQVPHFMSHESSLFWA